MARLRDRTCSNPDEEVELPMAQLAEEDLSLVQPGAVFDWRIGYEGERSKKDVKIIQIPSKYRC